MHGLDEEGTKCWGGGTQLKRLSGYVVEELPNDVPPLYKAEAAGLSVMVWDAQTCSWTACNHMQSHLLRRALTATHMWRTSSSPRGHDCCVQLGLVS